MRTSDGQAGSDWEGWAGTQWSSFPRRGRKDIFVRRETEILEGEVEDKRKASRLRWGGVGRNSVE